MVGTLTVQNLQGPASGANANKVIIPSGHVLDASAGFVPEAGAVVQCVQYYNPITGYEQTASTSMVASSITKTITPKFENSLIIVQSSIAMADPISDYMMSQMYLNGSPMTGSSIYQVGYQNSSYVRYAPFVFQGNYTCTTTSPLTFTVYYRSGNGTNVRITHADSSSALTLWEIAQ